MWTKLYIVALCVLLALAVGAPRVGAALQSDATTITSQGAGSIAIGSPLDTLDGFEIAPTADLAGVPNGFDLSIDGRVVASVATDGGTTGEIQLIVVRDPMFQTVEGIGVDSTVAAAEAAYGTAILSYDAVRPTTELLSVSSGPVGVQFFTSDDGGPAAGIYPADASVTIDYDSTATITSIWVDCRLRECPEPTPVAASSIPSETAASSSEATTTPVPHALAATGHSRLGAMVGLVALGAGLATLGARNGLRTANDRWLS